MLISRKWWKLAPKCVMPFIDFDIFHRLVQLRKLCSVTLIYIFKVKHFLLYIYNKNVTWTINQKVQNLIDNREYTLHIMIAIYCAWNGLCYRHGVKTYFIIILSYSIFKKMHNSFKVHKILLNTTFCPMKPKGIHCELKKYNLAKLTKQKMFKLINILLN